MTSRYEQVTAEELMNAVLRGDRRSFDVRDCSACHRPTRYAIVDGQPFLEDTCDCAGSSAVTEPRTWGDLADVINVQSSDKIKESVAELFGCALKENDKYKETTI